VIYLYLDRLVVRWARKHPEDAQRTHGAATQGAQG